MLAAQRPAAIPALTLLAALALSGCTGSADHDWSRQDAHRRCGAAIDAYPEHPAPACQALNMCINEARLTVDQQRKLLQMIRANGCPEP